MNEDNQQEYMHASAESVERRPSADESMRREGPTSTQKLESRFPRLARTRQAAVRDSSTQFANLLTQLTPALLLEAFRSLRRSAARGVDGMSCEDYEVGLEGRIQSLCTRIHEGRFRATPSKRVWIDKSNGQKRPLGIPALEDKIVQRALVWVMQSVYEVDFCNFSYGFRPARSCHNALDAVSVAITERKVSWVLDADIQGFFDAVDHEHLMAFIGHRISDPRLLALIKRFLKAGIIEDGIWSETGDGTPQGGILSPLLANIYLHYSLDLWAKWWRTRHARGEVYIVRYADDFVVCFQYRNDAEYFQRDLRKRMQKFSLTLHPTKTQLIEFGRFAEQNRQQRGAAKPHTFDFLGFTHACRKRRSDGGFKLQRTSIAKRFQRKLKEIRIIIIRNRHQPISQQGQWIRSVTTGYMNYFAVPGNLKACNGFRQEVNRIWYRALRRRSQKAWITTGWKRIQKLVAQWVAKVYVRHPYPNKRLCV